MGLDQYAYVVKKTKNIKDIYDNDEKERPFIVNDNLFYWRKNYRYLSGESPRWEAGNVSHSGIPRIYSWEDVKELG